MRGFAWRQAAGIPLLEWTAAPAGVHAVFSCRAGGVSRGPWSSLNLGLRTGDEPARVLENRRLLCVAAGVDPARTRCLHQVPGRRVRNAEELPGSFTEPEPEPGETGDALWTDAPGTGLVAFGADCLTVVIAREDGSRVATAHAGWPGLLAGVLEEVAGIVGADDGGGSGGRMVAAIGPSASPSAYEVGPDVGGPLVERFGAPVLRDGRADLWACATTALRSAGVARVDVAGLCTIGDERFFSHRRTGLPRGVQGAVAHVGDIAA
jgi:YfiH family protein